MNADAIKTILPAHEHQNFDDIVTQKVLGASTHIRLIGDMFVSIAEACAATDSSLEKLLGDVNSVAAFFQQTRGEASSAVSNAICLMLGGIHNPQPRTMVQAVSAIKNAVNSCSRQLQSSSETLTDFAVALCRNMRQILVFDYSSTVDLFLRKLGNETAEIHVYIPESRIINGGYAYIPTSMAAGFQVHFIPDSAILHFIRQCDGAFIGAETFYADGTALNTIGSDMLGLACATHHVPLYVLTPLIKLDMRPLHGFVRTPVYNGLRTACAENVDAAQLDLISFDCPELLEIEPHWICAFITEAGIIPPYAMYPVATDYMNALAAGGTTC